MVRARRLGHAVAAAMVATVALGAPAMAQYEPGPGGTTAPAPPSPLPDVAEASDHLVTPGDPVTITSGGGFTPGATGPVSIVRARQGAAGAPLGQATVGDDGRVRFTFTVPDVEPGIYIVVVEIDGERIVAVLAVLPIGADAGTPLVAAPAPAPGPGAREGDGGEAAATVPVPDEVKALQQPPEVERDLYAAVVEDGATLQLDGTHLVAASAPATAGADDGSGGVGWAVPAAGATGALAVLAIASRRLRRSV